MTMRRMDPLRRITLVRTLELPFPVDPNHIIATLDNGILTVNLRKSGAVMPRRIQVRSAEQRSLTGGETHHSPGHPAGEGSRGTGVAIVR